MSRTNSSRSQRANNSLVGLLLFLLSAADKNTLVSNTARSRLVMLPFSLNSRASRYGVGANDFQVIIEAFK